MSRPQAPLGPSPNAGADSAWWRAAILLLVPLHWLITAGVLGLGTHHVLLGLAILLLAAKGMAARRLLWVALPFWLTGVLYEYSVLWAATGQDVHVADLYRAELDWFAVDLGGGPEVAAIALQKHTHRLLDLFCGAAYIAYLFVPMIVAVILTFRRPRTAERIAWGFFAVMVLGMIIYQLFPAAPPWYVAEYGLGSPGGRVPADAAGLTRFDALIGFPFFAGWYANSPQVFAAMPSLHVAYPVALALATARLGWGWRVGTVSFAVLVAFSAVYLGHHYILDVLAGLSVGLLGDQLAWRGQIWLFWSRRSRLTTSGSYEARRLARPSQPSR